MRVCWGVGVVRDEGRDCSSATAPGLNRYVVPDYWVAYSTHAGILWIFQQRLTGDDTSGW